MFLVFFLIKESIYDYVSGCGDWLDYRGNRLNLSYYKKLI